MLTLVHLENIVAYLKFSKQFAFGQRDVIRRLCYTFIVYLFGRQITISILDLRKRASKANGC